MKNVTKPLISPRLFSRVGVACLCLAAAMPFVAIQSVQGAFLEYSASAYGTYAFVGKTVIVAQTAPCSVGSGCGTPAVGATASGTVASINASPTEQTGTINTSAASALNQATGTADAHGIKLLGTLITGDDVKAVSTTSHDNGGFHTSAAGSSFTNLVANGQHINSAPPANTTIQLAGYGHVVLNEQILSGSGNTKHLTVNMIHVYVTVANPLNIATGTQIIVSHAISGLTQINGPGSLDGDAFGTQVSGKTVKSSPTAPVGVGCQGNALTTKTQVGINVPFVLSSGTIQDTAQGSVTASLSSSQTSSTVQTVNVLNGIVTASTVQGQASASTTNGTTFNFNGTGSFVNLTVMGHPEITASVSANAQVSLAGVGTLYLKRVTKTTNSVTVHMIEIVLASNNVLGLPAGTRIIVGSASASLHSPAHP